MLAAWPAVNRRLPRDLSTTRKVILGVLLLAMLGAPDADILTGIFSDAPLKDYHNYFSHSLAVAIAAAIPFALACGWVARGHWWFWYLMGLVAYLSHVAIDTFTWGRGVQLFWPISEVRVSSPFPIFYGVRHSVGAPWMTHLITIANDLAFALLVWWIVRWRRFRAANASSRSAT